MTEFENLKRSYFAAIQCGLAANAGYCDVKNANIFIYEFCKTFIDNSGYNDIDKETIKLELKLLKDSLTQEIKEFYNK